VRRQTAVAIEGPSLLIDGRPTYPGRTFRGMKVEGLLMNARLVQGVFDDLNPATRRQWDYPDGPWDPQRNTDEFVAAMPAWRERGLVSFTLNLQGGSPRGYCRHQPWHNSAFRADGSLRDDYLARLAAILDAADALGMAPIVGYFYFGQDQRLADEAAVIRAADNATAWLLKQRYGHVLVEIDNEADNAKYDHAILRADRVGELIERVQRLSAGAVDAPAGRLLVSASLCGGVIPPAHIAAAADFLLLHGNGVDDPGRIRWMVDRTRQLGGAADKPIVFNEDDHFDFDAADNNMLAAVSRYAGWGCFDYRMAGEGHDDGFQSVPVNWGISSPRKRGFFDLLARLTGGA